MGKKIELHNYRCYSYFEKEFNEKLEIIQGRNGTGKSTICKAIYKRLGQDGESVVHLHEPTSESEWGGNIQVAFD